VREAADEWRHRIAAEPCEVLWRQMPDALWASRDRLARFVGAPPQSIAFMANVTAGVNIVAAALRLDAGREVLVTDQEYGAMLYAWERAVRRSGAGLRTIPLPVGTDFTAQEIIARFEAAIDARTQVVFLSHITTTTGLVLPVREICEIARRRGAVTVIDGAHAPGMIPLDIASLGCDFYIGNGHKWLLAPVGTGFLYTRRGCDALIEPLVVSWGWQYDHSIAHDRDSEGSTPFLRSLEFQGTRDPAPWFAVPAAIDFHDRIGRERILNRDRDLARFARSQLAALPGVEPAIPDDPALSAALVAYRVPFAHAGELQRRLWSDYHIETPVLDRCGGVVLRVSTHFYNTTEELVRLRDALAELMSRR
jgi:isopenicillin-N epimerase